MALWLVYWSHKPARFVELNVFLVWLPDSSLHFCCPSSGSNCQRHNHTFHISHSFYLRTWTPVFIFSSFFAWYSSPLLLQLISRYMFSIFLFLIIISCLFSVTSVRAYNSWFHNTDTSCSHTGLELCVCVCVWVGVYLLPPLRCRLHCILLLLFPLCRVFTLIYLKQTTFLGYAVSQLFCMYYSWCI
jgi:hypothetical protein